MMRANSNIKGLCPECGADLLEKGAIRFSQFAEELYDISYNPQTKRIEMEFVCNSGEVYDTDNTGFYCVNCNETLGLSQDDLEEIFEEVQQEKLSAADQFVLDKEREEALKRLKE